jgi:hypothetical protein
VVFDADIDPASRSVDVANFRAIIYTGTVGFGIVNLIPLAVVTDSAPDTTLAKPVRVTFASPSGIQFNGSCSSGLLGVNPTFGGVLYLIGTLVH